MSRWHNAVILCLVIARTAFALPPTWCGANEAVPAQRVFAQIHGTDPWQEYKSIKAVPELEPDGGTTAQLWVGTGHTQLVRVVEPSEDFWIYTEYCFDRKGDLAKIRFEVRTGWDWGYKTESAVVNGVPVKAKQTFFNTKTQKPIPRPNGTNDIPDALHPTIARTTKDLPFASLLR